MYKFMPWSFILLGIIISFMVYPNLPDQLAIHWSNGQADNFVNKNIAIFTIPVLMLISNAFISVMLSKSSFKKNNTKNVPIIQKVNNYLLFFLLILHCIILAIGLGFEVSMGFVQGLIIGVVIICLANPMQKAKPNHIYGLRTPWTLKDERVWKKANRFSAKLLVIIGLMIFFLSFVIPEYITTISLIFVLAGTVVAVLYSFIYYRKLRES